MKKYKLLSLSLLVMLDIRSFYQSIIINNQEIASGVRDSSQSYSVIKNFLKNYHRPFTILDLGAAQGFFSFKIGFEFDATCVMVEGDFDYRHTEKLLELCKLNTKLDNIIFLKHRITPQMLQLLGSCEHFDVILALNFIHHCGENTKAMLESLINLGDYLIVENPPTNEFPDNHGQTQIRKFIENFLLAHGGKVIAEVPRHTSKTAKSKIILLKTDKKIISNKHVLWNLYNKPSNKMFIDSTFDKKKFTKTMGNKLVTSNWMPGINLLTFKCLGGIYPTIDTVKKEVERLSIIPHPDWGPANMVIQGNSIQMIDFYPFGSVEEQEYRQAYRKKLMNKLLDLNTLKEIGHFYWSEFTPARTRSDSTDTNANSGSPQAFNQSAHYIT